MSGALLAQSYDIVIKGGHIIDPVNNIDQVMDLAIKGGKIAAIKKNIPNYHFFYRIKLQRRQL